MSIAAINASVLALTEQISNIELDIMLIDERRQFLNLNLTELQTEYSTRVAQKTLDLSDENLSEKEKDDLKFDWDSFKIEYEAVNAKIQAQDKNLEMERTALQTEKEELSTALESEEKRLQKNVEAEMKGANA